MPRDHGLSVGLPNASNMAAPHCARYSLEMPRSDTLQNSSSPSGLQVFVLFNALGSHSYGAFRGGRSGLCPCSVAYPRGASCPFDCLIRGRVQRLDIACESRAGGNQSQERSPDTPPLLFLSPQ